MAHKKGGGSSRNGRDSKSKRLGVKRHNGEVVMAGSILVRQRGTKILAGDNPLVRTDGFVDRGAERHRRRGAFGRPRQGPRQRWRDLTQRQLHRKTTRERRRDGVNEPRQCEAAFPQSRTCPRIEPPCGCDDRVGPPLVKKDEERDSDHREQRGDQGYTGLSV